MEAGAYPGQRSGVGLCTVKNRRVNLFIIAFLHYAINRVTEGGLAATYRTGCIQIVIKTIQTIVANIQKFCVQSIIIIYAYLIPVHSQFPNEKINRG